MAKVKILVEGYAKEIKSGWLASSTITFVEDGKTKIITDPGCSREKLLKALSEINLKPADIDFVFLTHNHTDHSLLAGIFEKAKVIVGSEIYDNDKQIEYGEGILGSELKIIRTPGHSYDHLSLIAPTEEGVSAVAGDVFWWTDEEEKKSDKESLLNHKDPYAKDENKLDESRKKILSLADFIIPGHGPMFKTMRKTNV